MHQTPCLRRVFEGIANGGDALPGGGAHKRTTASGETAARRFRLRLGAIAQLKPRSATTLSPLFDIFEGARMEIFECHLVDT